MAIYLYSRVSTKKQESSTEQQSFYLEDFCQRKGFSDYILLEDSAISGTKPLFTRPQGSRLKTLKDGDVIICLKHDRMFRNLRDAVNIVSEWYHTGVSIYLLNLGELPINMNNPYQKFMVYQLMLAAELERDMTSLRTRENLQYRKANHKTYSTAPYGWDNVGDRNKDNKIIQGRLEQNEYEQGVITEMRSMREQGKSYGYIANYLNECGVPAKKGGQWHMGAIQVVLENELNKRQEPC